MKKIRLLFFSLLAFVAISFSLKAQTVADVIVESENHQTLEAALLAAELVDTLQGAGPFTVFAPTDAAFDALPEGTLDELLADPTGDLTKILLYHVVADSAVSADLSDGQIIETLLGQNVTVTISDDGVFINDAQVTTADIEAENGVVHVIDVVLMPDLRPETVVDIVTANDTLSTLVAALTREDLTTDFLAILEGDGPFTVFAPTNAAFDSLFTELGVASLDEIDAATLDSVLQMHVLNGRVLSTDLTEGMTALSILDQVLTFSVEDGASVTDPTGRVSNITDVDMEAQNGVVHLVDTVLLYGDPLETVVDIAVAKSEFSTLVEALTREDLTTDFITVLEGEGPFTVFAPTNAAFDALFVELGVASLDEIGAGTLDSVLQMHVLNGRVLSADLTEGMTAPTLLEQDLTFSIEDSATITDPNGRVSNITEVDIEALNGVVHAIDTVLLYDMRPETVVDIATSDDNFSTLVAALTREDLTTDFIGILEGEGPFTVFAPTNAAFDALFVELGVASLDEIDAATLDSVLLMHVLDGRVMSTDLSEGMKDSTLLGQELTFSIEDSATVTDPNGRMSNITIVDLEAQNGVVHAIDTVLLYDMRPETVVDIATSDDNFSTLVAALTREDLTTDFIGILEGDGPFTVFAPTNAAFEALFVELGVASLDEIGAGTLDSVLQMHVIDGRVMSGDLSEGMTAETLLGQELTFNIEDSATVTDPNGRMSNITEVDLNAQNGVVHAIDTVLLYDMRPATVVDIATSDDNFSTLVAALTREDLTTDFTGILTGEGPFTVFAPTNDAFDALFVELGVASLDEIDAATLDSVLQMHVIRGRVMSEDLSEGLTTLTLLGQVLTFSVEDGASIIDPTGRVSNITDVDMEAQNGVVHAIDTVLLHGMVPETVVDIVTANNDFSTLVSALTREDLTTDFIDVLSGEGPFTVFAPTNAAFEDLFEELGVASLDDIDAVTLENVLQMHVLSGLVMSADITEGLTAETLLGQELTFSLVDGATITDPNGRVSNITEVDIEAQNGVVHVVDTVILHDLATSNIPDIAKVSFNFYPNPANNYITVTTENELSTLRIIDVSGKMLLSRKMVQPVERIDLNGMKSGVYFISLESEGSVVTQKLLISR